MLGVLLSSKTVFLAEMLHSPNSWMKPSVNRLLVLTEIIFIIVIRLAGLWHGLKPGVTLMD